MSKIYSLQGFNQLAQNVIKEYDSTLVSGEPQAIPIDEIIELHTNLRIRYENLSKNGNIHGLTVFENCLIPIFEQRNNEYAHTLAYVGDVLIERKLLAKNRINRLRFTLAHELAHWLIHQESFKKSEELACKTSSASAETIEKEADYLAAALLMPEGRVRVAFKRHKGMIHGAVIHQLSSIFQVSPQAMALRLRDLNLSGRRYETVVAEGINQTKQKIHALLCPHCSSNLGNIIAETTPFDAESTGLSLSLLCHKCKKPAKIVLENA